MGKLPSLGCCTARRTYKTTIVYRWVILQVEGVAHQVFVVKMSKIRCKIEKYVPASPDL